jgi:hypothetical protein
MALTPIKQPVRETRTKGRPSGANVGGLMGAIAAGGALAATVATGGAAAPTIPAALGTVGAGASLGSLVGGQVQQAEAPTVSQEMLDGVPTQRMAQGSQQLLDGLRALESYPNLAQKYSQPLTQAYIQSQIQLKRRSV